MELIFIRHGQGVHNTNVPDRLNIDNPQLTGKGKLQVRILKSQFTLKAADLFIVSPTIRTIETTNIITSDLLHPRKYISPLVGPRMFPLPLNPEAYAFKCDRVYPIETIEREHVDYHIMDQDDHKLWLEGINTIEEKEFQQYGEKMMKWIKLQGDSRVFIIAHDGTITNYRRLLGEENLTRADFLGEAGWHRVVL